jgi:hypothetical protein
LFSGDGRVRKWWGGYHPKVWDGHALQIQQKWIRKKLKDGVVIADQHFEWGREIGRGKVQSHTPYKIAKKKTKGATTAALKKKQKYNQHVRAARARVESWFGQMQREGAGSRQHLVWQLR